MADKYKIKITKAYHIAIEDKDGYEVASDWSFLNYTETKKKAEKMLAETEREMKSKLAPTTEQSCGTCKYRELYECNDCRFASKWERIEVE